MTRGVVAGMALLFMLLAAGVLVSFWTGEAALHRAIASTASVEALCQSGNEIRAEQMGLWTFAISISHPPPHETTTERAQRLHTLKLFEDKLHKIFTPKDCATLAPDSR